MLEFFGVTSDCGLRMKDTRNQMPLLSNEIYKSGMKLETVGASENRMK